MRNSSHEPWFSGDGRPQFAGDEPAFFNARELPWVARIEAEWAVIREELTALMQEHERDLVPYANRSMATKPDQWKSFIFMYWNLKSRRNCARCPRTWDILRDTPNLTSCGFSLLEPGTTIKPHQGDTNAVFRCHLGLIVPGGAPECAFKVATETRSWHEGQMLVFCDAHTHTAWNNTSHRRCVLLLDVVRPEYASRTLSISSRVLSKIYLEIAYQRLAWLREYCGGRRRRAALSAAIRTCMHVVLRFRLPVPPLLWLS
jgi:aspartyl/asparaginyl beta-hydroxylase (cupin superfamily)